MHIREELCDIYESLEYKEVYIQTYLITIVIFLRKQIFGEIFLLQILISLKNIVSKDEYGPLAK